jgi:hypothetical protein
MRSTLSHSEIAVKILEDIHPKINHIMESDAIIMQVRGIVLKVSNH